MSQSAVLHTAQNNTGTLTEWNWQHFQHWYSEFTGKKESMQKSFSEPLQLTYTDLEDIHHRILQTAQPYPKVAESMHISVSFKEKKTEVYSSFERFKTQSAAGNTAVKNITLEYNFAIKATESDDIGNYKLTIDIASGLAVFKEIQEEIPKIFWSNVGYRTIKAKIDYVDYAIANSFMATIAQWTQSRKQASKRKVFDWVQGNSKFIPLITRFFMLVACAFFLISAADAQLHEASNQLLAKFLVLAAIIAWTLNEASFFLGKTIERSIDQIWKIAYLKLNEGDERLIQEVQDNNKNCWISIGWQSIVYLALTACTALIKQVVSGLL